MWSKILIFNVWPFTGFLLQSKTLQTLEELGIDRNIE